MITIALRNIKKKKNANSKNNNINKTGKPTITYHLHWKFEVTLNYDLGGNRLVQDLEREREVVCSDDQISQ